MSPAEIREARQTLGLDGDQMSKMLGYGSRTRIAELEHGRRKPSAAVLRLLRAYLDGYRPEDWPGERKA